MGKSYRYGIALAGNDSTQIKVNSFHPGFSFVRFLLDFCTQKNPKCTPPSQSNIFRVKVNHAYHITARIKQIRA